MTEELSGKRFRELAIECEEEAKQARSAEIREGYEHMARKWLKLAEEAERLYGGDTRQSPWP